MPIQILPARLANQIAAGEVVERPASVVKELVENSIDAGATRIDIDIEKGGSKLIRIRDNGFGIAKDELTLALSRHATSKITTLDDLEAIVSLGFRGEALASISSVSRLTLTSRTVAQEEAWSAYAEGRDMEVKLKPAAHPIGTTIDVVDLFFNTPARRKFLRTDKTEFTHIDELLKRIALSRLDITINLRHNGKQVRQYRAAQTKAQVEKRLAAICGSHFLQHALEVELEHGELKFHGWISSPEGARAQGDIQYCYVNGRMMKDKLINHAIRQGYESSLLANQYAAYILFIEINPHDVDVNVHPAKHEVRFHQARLVHDFIYQAIYGALQQSISSPELSYNEEENEECSTFHEKEIHFPPMKEYVRQPQQASIDRTEQLKNAVDSTPNYPNKAPSDSWVSNSPSISKSSSSNGRSITYQNDRPSQKELTNYSALLNTPVEDKRSTNHQVNEGHLRHLSDIPTVESYVPILSIVDDKVVSLGKVLTVVEKGFALLQKGEQLQLLNLHYAEFVKSYGQLNSVHNEALRAQPLLIPLSIGVEETICRKVLDYALFLKPLGIDLKVKNRTSVIVMAVCQPIRQQNLQQLIPNLLRYLDSINPSLEQVIIWLSHQVQHEEVSYSNAQAIQLVMELEQLWGDGLSQFNQKLLKNIDITQVIQAFSHE
ncbi:DNA mismatch repair endonuclease MutL [Aliivibrio finisterrensis]|uniref:DNA mismatch repair protein MutL n=1 Tax=Aliivibrio finisterrensis TaxID=511998 RepID=A0A4Q5KG34_9GAMM|nr:MULTISPECIES: DNA mismatch repair endonuclease MutL [Aliivibrio]MDD9175754.1 DNA mismatch repair endonuclease MutL [Aliivibrio sp. S3TY1]MDD9180466.1 DNA mismatch repair endonuclease MutL [Aliivibrio sp. A6]MDD9192672.1 DNA mismatch repair endonuclease MutL [Aliivibrio sp. S2TY2]RYU44065.1 DNA mismatch repair endonuclease MutL [Aliivibrio finisterrensis]RYU48377.1 DNA mismatch repair endonuclease MutL [Aliivibrio finisterrensis]